MGIDQMIVEDLARDVKQLENGWVAYSVVGCQMGFA